MGTVKKIVIFNFGQKIGFLTILKISDFCQKFGFWVFLEVTGHSGILEISIFLILSRFQNFDFFDFQHHQKSSDEGRPPFAESRRSAEAAVAHKSFFNFSWIWWNFPRGADSGAGPGGQIGGHIEAARIRGHELRI